RGPGGLRRERPAAIIGRIEISQRTSLLPIEMCYPSVGTTEGAGNVLPQFSMKRRDFITLLGGAATLAAPRVARGQQPARPGIGLLDASTAADTVYRVSAFRDGLKEAGFIDGHNVAIEFRWAENKLDRLPALAADLAQRQVAVIVGPNTAIRAAI